MTNTCLNHFPMIFLWCLMVRAREDKGWLQPCFHGPLGSPSVPQNPLDLHGGGSQPAHTPTFQLGLRHGLAIDCLSN